MAQDAVVSQTTTIKSLAMRYQVESGEAAIDACAARQVRATVVIVDCAGNTRMQMIGDGGKYSFLEEARRKARTSAIASQSTTALQRALAANPNLGLPPIQSFWWPPAAFPSSPDRNSSALSGSLAVSQRQMTVVPRPE